MPRPVVRVVWEAYLNAHNFKHALNESSPLEDSSCQCITLLETEVTGACPDPGKELLDSYCISGNVCFCCCCFCFSFLYFRKRCGVHNYTTILYLIPIVSFHLGIIIRVETVVYKGIILMCWCLQIVWRICVYVQWTVGLHKSMVMLNHIKLYHLW